MNTEHVGGVGHDMTVGMVGQVREAACTPASSMAKDRA
jgi:hypothetical protein